MLVYGELVKRTKGMAAPNHASIFCEAPPAHLPFPLLISESLRSATSSDGSSTQGIVSILLSGADLVKLDLSKLQLFSLDGFVAKPAASMASSERQTELKTLSDDDFTFHTPLVLKPVSDLPPGTLAFPVLKSRGVVEAEKANAEHHLLKLGAVSPSPRARKKAVSMDEISLNENLSSVEDVVVENAAGNSKCKTGAIRDRVRARRQLPELELSPLPPPGSEQWAPLPLPGLEQRAENLRKKHFERVLSRTLSEVRTAEAKIDLKASPAAKFLLQAMPWELTPPVTPLTTPAAVPFIWEDVPGRPKPRALPSPCTALPLPPRLVAAPPPWSSSMTTCALACSPSSDSTECVNGDLSSSAGKPLHGRRHRKNMHSWHVLHNFFSGSNHECPLQSADIIADTGRGDNSLPSLVSEGLCFARGETSTDGVSATSTCINSCSTSSDFSPSIATPSEEKLSSCEASVSARYELPPLYVAPVTPLTPPYKGLGPLDDDCPKQTNRLKNLVKMLRGQKKERFRAGSFFHRFRKPDSSDGSSYLLNDAKEAGQKVSYGVHASEQTYHVHLAASPSGRRKTQSASTQLSPIVSNLYRSPVRGKHRNPSAATSTKVFIKLRRRGARVIVASFKAIKRALLLKRAHHSKLPNLSRLPYHALHR